MKLYNAKLGKTIEGTATMLKSLEPKGWIEIKEEGPVMGASFDDPTGLGPTSVDDAGTEVFDEPAIDEEFKPQAEPVKQSKAKTKNKK